uniref:mRNA-capping enzyme n=1 Tax=Meloidogyne hapla TaxID=6305 RepID=A0A1I8C0L7_MELHA
MSKRIRQENSVNGNNGNVQSPNKQWLKPKTRLPARWLYCPPMGKVVARKFLPMKTPLDTSYDHLIESPKYYFHPEMVFRTPLRDVNSGAQILLWIDLTNSNSFYQPCEIPSPCKYEKIKMVGHGEAPSVEQTDKFIEIVDKFFEEHPNDIVVVHCTHGFNRTGFLISSYLFKHDGLSIEMAIQEFASARPMGIYKQLYLDELHQRYGDEDDEKIESHGRPLWENGPLSNEEFTMDGIFTIGEEKNLNDDFIPSTSNLNIDNSNSPGKKAKKTPLFMDGRVPNVYFVEDPELRKSVQSQPVSLEGPYGDGTSNNIQFLEMEPYIYLVLIDGYNRVFAFDRDNNPFQINNVTFLNKKAKCLSPLKSLISEEDYLKGTLVDAEMVIDNVEGKEIPRLLIYDLIYFNNINLKKEKFSIRFKAIDDELIKPRIEALKLGIINRDCQSMGVRRKDFWPIKETYKIFQPGFLENVTSCHEIDGLVFQPVNRPYVAGRYDYLLKWKPPELATIDFRLEIKKIQRPGELTEWIGELHVLHLDTPFARLLKVTNQMRQYDRKIIECKYVREKGGWEFMRERTDKSHPNAYLTAKSVLNTIKYPINRNDILNFIHSFVTRKEQLKNENN